MWKIYEKRGVNMKAPMSIPVWRCVMLVALLRSNSTLVGIASSRCWIYTGQKVPILHGATSVFPLLRVKLWRVSR